MGGGRRELTPSTEPDPESGALGRRGDGRNIITEWTNYKKSVNQSVQYVWNEDQFDNVDPATTDNLIGIFEASHMRYSIESDEGNYPPLADMTEKAIRMLSKNPNGYFLFVEGAGIDLAHHDNYAHLALHDCVAFEAAVQRALDIVDLRDTLIIVTADHSHPLTTISYSKRGTDILGKPYFKVPAAVPNKWVSHDLTDVPIYATGAMGHLIHSTHEQNYIFHVMKYAGCMTDDDYAPHCVLGGSSGSIKQHAYWITWSCFLMLILHQFVSQSLVD